MSWPGPLGPMGITEQEKYVIVASKAHFCKVVPQELNTKEDAINYMKELRLQNCEAITLEEHAKAFNSEFIGYGY